MSLGEDMNVIPVPEVEDFGHVAMVGGLEVDG